MTMSDEEIYGRMNGIFRDVFDDEELIVNPDTTAGDVFGWDSLTYIRLILTVSKVFDVNFSASEISSFKNVGELVNAVRRRSRMGVIR
jgi:acyl carrier protein